MTRSLAVLLGAGAGMLVAMQAPINARLGRTVGGVQAATFSFLVGTAALGAPRPMRVPAFLARLAAGEYGVATMTRAQGASNERARRELGWAPKHPSWREGFRTALG